jgi:8-oxo-dGTP pyrophosphatase MutT (NUDIX family)
MQESARGVLLTPSGLVLLMKIASRTSSLWITPGGRIRPGEEAAAAAIREVREETGREIPVAGNKIWIRNGTYLADGERLPEREHFFLMPTERFEPSSLGMEPEERRRHLGFHWWRIEEIASSHEAFVPRRLAELLSDIRRLGPPAAPVESGE